MILFPNAKINIGLTISGKRPDGYHDLETVFYPVMMNDVLEVIESGKLVFDTSGLTIPGDPVDNLCLKAYHLLARDFKLPPVHIHLYKNIPTGAGLGGGSADASFFIRLMDMKFELGMSMDRRLCQAAWRRLFIFYP
jgi:4-diphosphocytidyl-2-C-methyl-D-erythritol kinase